MGGWRGVSGREKACRQRISGRGSPDYRALRKNHAEFNAGSIDPLRISAPGCTANPRIEGSNSRIIGAVAEQLGLPQEKVVCNLDRFGNTSSASIPLALDEIWTAGLINDGTRVLFTALGGGVTVGSVLVCF